jgi:hypothetical protein
MAQEEDPAANDEPQQLRCHDRNHLPLLAQPIRAYACSLASWLKLVGIRLTN